MDNFTIETTDELFRSRLPENLYYNHYDLAEIYAHKEYTPEEWRQYLKQNERFIMNEVSAITEASARSALQKLGDGKITSQQVAAIRQLLEHSEQINSTNKDARTFITLQYDASKPLQMTSAQQKKAKIAQNHQKAVHRFYDLDNYDALMHFDYRERNQTFMRNPDGTIFFPDTTHKLFEKSDLIYLRLFNPSNTQNDLPEFEDDKDLRDVQ
jgi:hypothetical protein